MVMARISALIILFTGLLVYSISAQAAFNPFKKTKNYEFGNDIHWQFQEDAAIKSGRVKAGADILYFHLRITKNELRLRLGKNDPSGEIKNSRKLSKMTIVDVLIDGRRFKLFQRCLDNQQPLGKKLKPGALVANDACVNMGAGDFIAQLDTASRNELKASDKLVFIVEPYGRKVKLSYSMLGFEGIMSQLDKPPMPVVVEPVVKPAPKPVVEPVAKPIVKKKVVKICVAKPPADFRSAVKSVSYPCENKAGKVKAEKSVAVEVNKEKRKMAAEIARLKQQEEELDKASEYSKKEIEWAKKQKAMWIKRCQKHWNKGTSPCFCEKYLDDAPAGVNNTCGS
jgi:hypothetical protein